MYKKLSFAGLLVLLLAATAFAQFEVSPDHFDGTTPRTSQTAQRPKSVTKKTVANRSRSAQAKKRLAAKQHKPERVIAKK